MPVYAMAADGLQIRSATLDNGINLLFSNVICPINEEMAVVKIIGDDGIAGAGCYKVEHEDILFIFEDGSSVRIHKSRFKIGKIQDI